ncbi:hypothetical protein [uncultured Sphingomonas sp.]|uniref:hypothetical protein n=1 Tax=uncultured Sphingomonas sp. TaxID=158754 RepID=UPI0025FF936D|nr:hypothetical protein [uncultured Sphingomonas sp.]
MMRPMFAVLLALPLAACGGGSDTPAANTATPAAAATESEFQAKVAALTPAERNGVFIRAIRDAGLNCQEVTESTKDKKVGMWAARCADGTGYAVQILPDGTATVFAPAGAR